MIRIVLSLSIFLATFFIISPPILAVNLPSGVKPEQVTAVSGIIIPGAGAKYQSILTFWNVGQMHDNSSYHEAKIQSKCLVAPKICPAEVTWTGTFSGGPNGTFSFNGAEFSLTNGTKAVFAGDGTEVVYTVENPEVFSKYDWNLSDASKGKPEESPSAASDLPDVEYQPDRDIGIRFTGIRGEVKFYPDGDPENIGFAKTGSTIFPGTHIYTGEESNVTITFADNSTYKLPPNSEIVIRSNDPKSPLSLLTGHLWGNIKKIASGESIEIRTNQAVTGIKGTTFVLEENNGKTVLKVIEGLVSFTSQKTGDSQEIKTGESLFADVNGLGQKTAFDVNAEQVSWDALEKVSRKSSPSNNIVYSVLAVLTLIIIGTVLKFRKKKAKK